MGRRTTSHDPFLSLNVSTLFTVPPELPKERL
jgi:hypothetical protein